MSLSKLAQELKDLMEENRHNEVEAREYLQYAKDLFAHETPNEFYDFVTEYPTTNGDIDLIVPCSLEDDAGNVRRVVYIWEVKSPQTVVYIFDNKNRVKPSKELTKAENQLLHYCEECKQNQQFRTEFSIIDPEDVKLGGILIGQKETLVKDSRYSSLEQKSLFNKANGYRQKHFYRASAIKFLTWDKVLNQINSTTIEAIDVEPISPISLSDTEEQ
ncbi:hypothetical protein [Sulfurimonas marina]|uniref:DUF4263 domain-containing protein n=1 Tax=Sulfurimonas marina TaxID=2590551 RepID=A0A7M1B030_9BACT|nr:hypothetical protein [Sulfurimonas marina]QOP42148.1 hypothetical protein FJR03_10540 [Sulfurimonas marina]